MSLFPLCRFILVTAAVVPLWAHAQESFVQAVSRQQAIEAGKEVFTRNCMGCHGAAGDGKGEAAPMLSPKPRNLVSGSFKFRTTPSGSLPTLADLQRTIERGVLGTSMPSFRLLAPSERRAVALYIQSLRPDWISSENSVLPMPSPPEGVFTKKELLLASATRGRVLFLEACATCHGDRGLGDGPSAEGLIDGEEQPIRPANLSRPFIKSGRGVKDIYRAITTGLDGTPMPSFADVYSDAQRWDLAAYVMFRRGQGAGIYAANLTLDPIQTPVTGGKKKD